MIVPLFSLIVGNWPVLLFFVLSAAVALARKPPFKPTASPIAAAVNINPTTSTAAKSTHVTSAPTVVSNASSINAVSQISSSSVLSSNVDNYNNSTSSSLSFVDNLPKRSNAAIPLPPSSVGNIPDVVASGICKLNFYFSFFNAFSFRSFNIRPRATADRTSPSSSSSSSFGRWKSVCFLNNFVSDV